MNEADAAVDIDRRTVLQTLGVVAAGAVAGCSGSSGGAENESGGGGGGGSESGGSGGGETETSTATPDSESGSGSGSDAPDFDGFLDAVGNYDGTVVDETGASEVEIAVGAEGNGGGLAFDPPAVRVSTGTTIVWRWTGAGGSHNVAAEDGSFESELVGEEGHTFSHTVDSAGIVKYVCTPHEALGMKGAIVVE